MKTPDLMRSGGREDTHKNSSTFVLETVVDKNVTDERECVRTKYALLFLRELRSSNGSVRTEFSP